MTDTTHKGQLQVVEGSIVGDVLVSAKMDYGPCGSLLYLGESKTSVEDQMNRHFIQKFVYDSNYNLQRILVAQNHTNLGCTSVSISVLSPTIARITLLNGDTSEVLKDDAIELKTANQFLSGDVLKVVDTQTIDMKITETQSGPIVITPETATIALNDLLVRLEGALTKPYWCRRWTNRTRYLYA